MYAVYRERVADEELRTVTNYVRQWLIRRGGALNDRVRLWELALEQMVTR